MNPLEPPTVKLRADLERSFEGARADVGDAARLAAIASRLEPRIASSSPPSWRFVPHLVAGAVVTAAIAALLSHRPPASIPSAPSGVAVGVASSVRLAPAESIVEPEAAPSSAPELPSAQPLLPAAREPARTGVPRSPILAPPRPSAEPLPAISRPGLPDPIVEEHQILATARRSLDTAPAETLTRVAEHQERFPDGALASERELLRILALARLGRLSEASAARTSFLSRWPTSAYRGEIDRALGR